MTVSIDRVNTINGKIMEFFKKVKINPLPYRQHGEKVRKL